MRTAVHGRGPASEVTKYISTKQMQPDTMLALRELVNDLKNEVTLYKEYKAAGKPADQRSQRYVRGERSDP